MRGVDDVLITAELATRPSPAPNFQSESRALGQLAHEMANNPRGVLQKCAELVMELCHADSAGISILEPGEPSGIIRWHAAAGAFAANLHATMPQEASPCGTVMERNCVLLFHEAERFFRAVREVQPRIFENLLAPWHAKGKAVGTIWAIKHTPEGRFNAEDARVLQSLARFAGAAFQMISALDEATAERTELKQRTEALRETEKRQAFLLELSDALRATPTDAIIERAVEMLADKLGLDLCYVVAVFPEEDRADVLHQLRRRSDMPGLPATIRLSDFPQAFVEWQERTLVSENMPSDPALTEIDQRNVAAMRFGGLIAAPVRRGTGKPIWSIVAVMAEARRWTAAEIALVEETAERTWAAVQRTRAEQALRESEGRARLLLAELQHRVRNILAMIRSIATRTASEEMSAYDYAQHLAGRLDAMARTQVILTSRPGDGIEIEDLIREELLAQATADDRFRLLGPGVLLWPKAAEVVTLAVHELTTNSIKYGSLGDAGGLSIEWNVETRDAEEWLTLVWTETGVENSEKNPRQGFGTELITRRIPYELQGTGKMEFHATGVQVIISFPLRSTGSILETGTTADEAARQ